MQVKVSTRHGEVSEQTTAKIISKVEKLERFYDRLTEASVTLDLSTRANPKIDITVSADRKKDFVADAQAGELFISLDDAIRKIEQQVKKFKEKLQDRRPDVKRLDITPEEE